jgi:nicotinamidase-related amidase
MGQKIGFGNSPAVVVIDLQVAYTDRERSPLAGDLDAVIRVVEGILAVARSSAVPIIFTVEGWAADSIEIDAGLTLKKVPTIRQMTIGSEFVQLDPRVTRTNGEPLLIKKCPSAFFGTSLAGMLTALGVDTLIIVGCSTSGCIRASAMDALNHGFRPIVPFDAVGDRAPEPHAAALFDIEMKYGDVVSAEDVRIYLEQCRAGDATPRTEP